MNRREQRRKERELAREEEDKLRENEERRRASLTMWHLIEECDANWKVKENLTYLG